MCQIWGFNLEQHHEDYNTEIMDIIFKFEQTFQSPAHFAEENKSDSPHSPNPKNDILSKPLWPLELKHMKRHKKMMSIIRKQEQVYAENLDSMLFHTYTENTSEVGKSFRLSQVNFFMIFP